VSFLAHTKVALHSCSGVVFVAWAVRARNEMTSSSPQVSGPLVWSTTKLG
jgi:hypothetical protein